MGINIFQQYLGNPIYFIHLKFLNSVAGESCQCVKGCFKKEKKKKYIYVCMYMKSVFDVTLNYWRFFPQGTLN